MHFSRRIHDQISSKWEKHKKKERSSLTTTTPQRFNNLPLWHCKDTKFLPRTAIRHRCFFFLGDSRSGWPLEAAACHAPSVGGVSFSEAPPRLRNARATPFNEKSRKPFCRGVFPRVRPSSRCSGESPHRVPSLAGKRNRETLPLAKFRNPLTPNTKKIFFFFPPL